MSRSTNAAYAQFDALRARDRRDAFNAAAEALGASAQAIEKDFWVCRAIDAMFTGFGSSARPKLYFKGGTSLSKGYGLIKRFSEDIDIVVSRRGLLIPDADDPLSQASTTKRKKATEVAMERCCAFVSGRMRSKLAKILAMCRIELDAEDKDGCTLQILYPSLLDPNGYIAPWVKIEVGARGAITPCAERAIEPYVQSVLAGGWDLSTSAVAMIEAERTFLEKALILHGNHCRMRDNPNWKPSDRNHMARHYYDVAMMRDTKIGYVAMRDDLLLEDVRQTKIRMFPAPADKLNEAKRGAILLTPQAGLRRLIQTDYDAMAGMMFHDPPEFEWVMAQINLAEAAINKIGERVATSPA